jgi:chitinase
MCDKLSRRKQFRGRVARYSTMPALSICFLACFLACFLQPQTQAQGTVPTFSVPSPGKPGASFTLAGNSPTSSTSTTLPTTLVPVRLIFDTNPTAGFDAAGDVAALLDSPVYSRYRFGTAAPTQYTDALLRASFPASSHWHTLLGKPTIHPLDIHIPASDGYILSSRKSAGSLAVVDADYVQQQAFRQLPSQPGRLVLLLTHNTTFYAAGDATICCTWGTHGIDPATGTSFVMGSYLVNAPSIVTDRDVQPLTQQLAEFFYDPRHNPQHYGYNVTAPGNTVPAWMRANPDDGCGGTGIGSSYFLLEPNDTNPKNNIPAGSAYIAHAAGQPESATWHLADVPLLPWYFGKSNGTSQRYSFPDAAALPHAAQPCIRHRGQPAASIALATPTPAAATANGHRLIGYWTGHGPNHQPFPLRDVSPQWDVVIVAFASPVKNAPEGTLAFGLPEGIAPPQLKADIALMHQQGRKVLISLGGGGAFFTLDKAASIPTFVACVTKIVTDYGFDGVDIDFESPSLLLDANDHDLRHPSSPSIVHLITGLRQLHDHFGKDFMLSLVPEGPQIPGGFQTYGGQFGSYLPITYGLRDILSFVDVQDYNTPPFEGLDGEIYQSHTVDYHAALTELVLQGFHPGGDPAQTFPAVPADKVAVGFLTDYEKPRTVVDAMGYLVTGQAPAGTTYVLHQAYPGLLGAMFWTIDDDRAMGYAFSNTVGPRLHSLPAATLRRR